MTTAGERQKESYANEHKRLGVPHLCVEAIKDGRKKNEDPRRKRGTRLQEEACTMAKYHFYWRENPR
jgi:hypothetical protein